MPAYKGNAVNVKHERRRAGTKEQRAAAEVEPAKAAEAAQGGGVRASPVFEAQCKTGKKILPGNSKRDRNKTEQGTQTDPGPHTKAMLPEDPAPPKAPPSHQIPLSRLGEQSADQDKETPSDEHGGPAAPQLIRGDEPVPGQVPIPRLPTAPTAKAPVGIELVETKPTGEAEPAAAAEGGTAHDQLPGVQPAESRRTGEEPGLAENENTPDRARKRPRAETKPRRNRGTKSRETTKGKRSGKRKPDHTVGEQQSAVTLRLHR